MSPPNLCAMMDVLAARANGMHTEQMRQTLSCRWGSGSRKHEAQLWTRLHLHYGIIEKDFSTYNLSDLATCEFEIRVSDFLQIIIPHGLDLPFLDCALLLLHTVDTELIFHHLSLKLFTMEKYNLIAG